MTICPRRLQTFREKITLVATDAAAHVAAAAVVVAVLCSTEQNRGHESH